MESKRAARRLRVINLFGPPGVGKSSLRSGVFWLMKTLHMRVEEVTEYAKYLVLSGRSWQLRRDPLYLLAKQHHKQLVLEGQYDYAVTDSPLMLSAFYASEPLRESLLGLARELTARFDNVNFYVRRDLRAAPFEVQGRVHSLEESERLDQQLRQFLAREGVHYIDIALDETAPLHVVRHVAQPRALSRVRQWVRLADGEGA